MRPVIVLLSLLLAGCIGGAEKSNLADDLLVTVRGKALDPAGNGLGGGTATLSTNNPLDFGGITDVQTGADLHYQGTSTNVKGEFALYLRGRQTKNGAGQAQDFDLLLRSAESLDQPSITRAVRFTTQDVQLLDFRLWDALRADTSTAGQVSLGWTAPTDEKPSRYDVELTSRDGATILYQPPAAGDGATLPDYVLTPNETYGYRVRAVMAYETRRSALHKLTAPANPNPKLLPLAAVRDLDGKDLPALKDDVLWSSAAVDAFIVDLGSVQQVGKVVLVHPSTAAYTYQTSGDAGDFTTPTTPVVTNGGGWLELDLGTTRTARYLKLTPVVDPSASPPPPGLTEVRVLKP